MPIHKWAGLVASGFLIAASGGANAQIALPQAVETTPLAKDAFSTGTLTQSDGALAATLWRGANAETLEFLLLHTPARPATPSLGDALRRTLLSSGTAPAGAAASLGGKKLVALSRAGFLKEAGTVASISEAGGGDTWTGQALALSDLLSGDVQRACQRNANLSSGRDEIFWVKLRVLCYAAADENDAADLTLNVLREQGALSESENVFLTAAATGAKPKSPPPARGVLEYAIARHLELPLAPGLIDQADGGVLVAITRDADIDLGTRLAAVQQAASLGVVGPGEVKALYDNVKFEVADLAGAVTAARDKANDPMTDALLYHSIKAMSAPEFLRDKSQRIALALSLGDTFSRAYALSMLYADDVTSLEGAIVSPEEAEQFAIARMAVSDAVGAGQWMLASLGGAGVSAMPQPRAMRFIDNVNLLARLDPQTAAQIARKAGVSLLTTEPAIPVETGAANQEKTARILEAAFDAAIDDKVGQAGLAALAASANKTGAAPGEINSIIVEQSLRVAGLSDLQRSHAFQTAWSATFADRPHTPFKAAAASPTNTADNGPMPRIKPAPGQ